MTHITCKLTAKNRDQLRNRTLGNRVWATFTKFFYVGEQFIVSLFNYSSSTAPQRTDRITTDGGPKWRRSGTAHFGRRLRDSARPGFASLTSPIAMQCGRGHRLRASILRGLSISNRREPAATQRSADKSRMPLNQLRTAAAAESKDGRLAAVDVT